MTTSDHVQNPYPVPDAFGKVQGWKWYDDNWEPCQKLYPSQGAALRDLMRYIKFLDKGPSLWQRLWWPVRYSFWPLLKRLWHDDARSKSKDQGQKGTR